MRRVILHAGGHKTGTSYFQAMCDANAALLLEKGIYYPKLHENCAHHILAAPWMEIDGLSDTFFMEENPDELWERFLNDVPAEAEIILLSAENFSRFLPKQVDFSEFRKRFPLGTQIELLYVWRDPVELVQSIWLERFKCGAIGRWEDLLQTARRTEKATGVPVVPDAAYRFFRENFSPQEITVLEYQAICKHPFGIVGAILEATGLKMDLQRLQKVDPRRGNISAHPQAAYIAHFLGGEVGAQRELVAMLGARIAPVPGKKALIYSRKEYQLTRQRFASNEERFLNARLEDGFSQPKPFRLSEEEISFREDVEETVWVDLTRRIWRGY